MGQGQEIVAREMIESSMQNGGWVLLQNVHLSLPFTSEAMSMVSDGENINESFRLWLTTEVHEQFPIGLLQMSIKFTNEPPQGIRASLKRTYQNISQDFLDYSSQPQWPPLLYAVAFLHTVVQERRKFGPLGKQLRLFYIKLFVLFESKQMYFIILYYKINTSSL